MDLIFARGRLENTFAIAASLATLTDVDAASPPPLLPTHRDRRTGLLVFGILEIVFGAFFALSLPLTMFSQFALGRQQGREFDASFVAPTLVFCGIGAGGLIRLGIRSIRGRRWARALLLILGWVGLVGGVAALAIIVPSLGGFEAAMRAQMRQQGQELPAAVFVFAKVMMVLTTFVFYVLIPGALILFYRSPHVKRTCELLDPTERWTDRAPLPVIALASLAAFGAGCVLFVPRFGGIMPVFGLSLTGWPARVVWLIIGAFSAYAARGLYRRDYRMWKLYLGFVLLSAVNYTVSLSLLGLDGYFRASGVPEWQIAQVTANPMLRGFTGWSGMIAVVPIVGLMFYLRRHFVVTDRARAVDGA